MANFKNPLSRSISKSTVLHYCVKKYYFSTYSNYLREMDEGLRNDAMLAKNIKSLAMRFGEVLHNLMSDYLHLIKNKQNSVENIKQIKTKITAYMDKFFQISKNKNYNKYDPYEKFGLNEHYYGHNIDDIYRDGKEKMMSTFDNFCMSDTNSEIENFLKNPENQIFIEPRVKDFESMKIHIDNIPELMGINIYAQPDFGIITKDKKYIIYDRKNGKVPTKDTNSISDQLKVYAYKTLQKIGLENIDSFDCTAYELFLKTLTQFGGKILKQDIFDIEKKIIDDVNFQKKLLINQDINENRPVEVEYFSRTDDLQKCKSCTFFKVCEELKKFEQGKLISPTPTPKENFIYDDEEFPF